MNESSQSRASLPSAVFFGFLESLAFLCLFLSLILSPAGASGVWSLIASLRILVLGLALESRQSSLPGRATRDWWYDGLRFLGEAILYQIPFWVSALFFPFGSQQTHFALHGLLLQTCGLIALALLVWSARLGAEAIVYGVSWMWVGPWWPGSWPLGLALAGFLVAWLLPRWRPRWVRRLTNGQVIVVGFAWLAVFGFAPVLSVNLGGILELVLYWILLLWIGAVAKSFQEEATPNLEVEGSTPGLSAGRFWFGGRQVLFATVGWCALLMLVLKEPRQFGVVICLGFGGLRALELAARGWFTSERWVWWAAAELSLLWAVDRSEFTYYPGWLLFSLVGWLWTWVRRGSRNSIIEEADAFGELEDRLRNGLWFKAPEGFAQRLASEGESDLEFEQDLTAVAPTGFRDRLLERLRQGEKDEDSA